MKYTTRIATALCASVMAIMGVSGTASSLPNQFNYPSFTTPDLPVTAQREAHLLQFPSVVAPGSKFINVNTNQGCTFAWAAHDSKSGLDGFLTAGHCGKAGDDVAVETSPGNVVPVGTIEWSAYDTASTSTRNIDLAFVSVTSDFPVSSQVQGINKTPVKVMDVSDMQRIAPDMCKTGQATGTTCGDASREHFTAQRAAFKAPSFRGDSGSPVYARTRAGDIVAIGVFTGSPTNHEDIGNAQVLSNEVLSSFGVEIVS